MADGALMQLVARGVQDVHLVGAPEITFFKSIHKQYTNFAIDSIAQTMTGTSDWGERVEIKFARHGDLVTHLWLQVRVPRIQSNGPYQYKWADDLGFAMIRQVTLEIGGRTIDVLPREWMMVHAETHVPEGKRAALFEMINAPVPAPTDAAPEDHDEGVLFVPIPFYFSKSPTQALPLIALQNHEVRAFVDFEDVDRVLSHWNGNAFVGRGLATGDALVDPFRVEPWLDFVFLDPEERARFASNELTYLVEQVQYTGADAWNKEMVNTRLEFNHPVKSLYWLYQDRTETVDRAEPLKFERALKFAGIQFNNTDRVVLRPGAYFRLVQPYQVMGRVSQEPIYQYSFALAADELQPSGACNFSRLDRVVLHSQTVEPPADPEAGKIHAFAVNYNFLKISSGMGGLQYGS